MHPWGEMHWEKDRYRLSLNNTAKYDLPPVRVKKTAKSRHSSAFETENETPFFYPNCPSSFVKLCIMYIFGRDTKPGVGKEAPGAVDLQ